MVARDSQPFEAVDDLPVEPPLGVDGAIGEAVHRHQRRILRFGQLRRVRKTMRLMHLKADAVLTSQVRQLGAVVGAALLCTGPTGDWH